MHQRKAGYGLAATRLAYDAYDRIFGYRERYAVHRFGNARVGEKVSVQIVEFDYVTGIFHLRGILARVGVLTLFALFELLYEFLVFLGYLARLFAGEIVLFKFFLLRLVCHNYLFILGSNASRRPSPTKLNASTASIMQIPTGIHWLKCAPQ